MSFTKTIQILFVSSLLASFHDPACADVLLYNLCSNTSNYADDSPFHNNLNSLFNSLLSNDSLTTFSYTSIGNDSDRVYGLYMCLNYITYETCNNCIATASENIVKLCPHKKEAAVWENSCQLRYSYENFFGQLDVTENIPVYDHSNISEPERYTSVVNNTLSNITKLAAFDSANMYATQEVPFTDTDTLYALVQCTRDLSADDCNTCLQIAIRNVLSSCCYVAQGARIFSLSCFLRYELYAFYEGATEPPSSAGNRVTGKGNQGKIRLIMILTTLLAFLLVVLASTIYILARKKVNNREREDEVHKIVGPNNTDFYQHIHRRDDLKAEEFYIDLKCIRAATDNFSDSNMLGQGGFGSVYKGLLSDGKEVAVKRLSSCSEQGTEEFTNEVLLILKLQHKNLVRLLGFCVDGDEKLLVYEFMPNSSLDIILFDPKKRPQLSWSKRLNIVSGIAKGILYLHEDSRLRIIHRDLKASNVLLDSEMNPKISDFGMAKIFPGSEVEANTARIVGTYGYMAPEYAMEGLYSTKSDVFSFGVLLLEIITGRRNASFHQSKPAPWLVANAWKLWNEGNTLELMDPLLTDTCCPDEFLRYIHIGLLCVQENAVDRPTMSSIVVMLRGDSVTLRQPERPAFFAGRFINQEKINANNCSVSALTLSDFLPR